MRLYKHRGNPHKPDEGKCERGLKLSPERAHEVIRAGWNEGSLHPTAHFKARCIERGFTLIDVGNVIRSGRMRGDAEYCPEFNNWKYKFCGNAEDRTLEVVVSLDPTKDYARPLIIVITGYWL